LNIAGRSEERLHAFLSGPRVPYRIEIGICGQAPSDYPEIVEFLVENGIDSISLNSDVIGRMKQVVAKGEEKYGKQLSRALPNP
jgi:phosphoenolpyruvate synthase/pyruvate phosphate dikinase